MPRKQPGRFGFDEEQPKYPNGHTKKSWEKKTKEDIKEINKLKKNEKI